MINSKIALIAAIAVVGAASPAFAQSFCTCYGTGNVLPFSYGPVAPPHGKIAVRQNGLDAFAMDPRAPSSSNSNDPAITGGGSLGYNQNLYNY